MKLTGLVALVLLSCQTLASPPAKQLLEIILRYRNKIQNLEFYHGAEDLEQYFHRSLFKKNRRNLNLERVIDAVNNIKIPKNDHETSVLVKEVSALLQGRKIKKITYDEFFGTQ